MASARSGSKPISFLFLGETLLIPHLYPIMEALAQADPHTVIEAWTSTQTHEVLLGRWLAESGIGHIRLRRAPGWLRTNDPERGINPELPAKLPLLARIAWPLSQARAVVSAEQTSLWLPRLLPMPPFVNTTHGVSPMGNRDGGRRKSIALFLVPSERERTTYLERGIDPRTIVATGYVKAGFRHLAVAQPAFDEQRPVVLYNPHWQQYRSSWWQWGEQAIEKVLETGRYNLIFAPHQRLIEGVSGLREYCARLALRGDTICDYETFAAVDGSYPHAADIYLGDTSSQLLEFLQRPRPAVFLDPLRRDWRSDPSLDLWQNGPVVTDLAQLPKALERAVAEHSALAAIQRSFVAEWMGNADGSGPVRAAQEILAFLERQNR